MSLPPCGLRASDVFPDYLEWGQGQRIVHYEGEVQRLREEATLYEELAVKFTDCIVKLLFCIRDHSASTKRLVRDTVVALLSFESPSTWMACSPPGPTWGECGVCSEQSVRGG